MIVGPLCNKDRSINFTELLDQICHILKSGTLNFSLEIIDYPWNVTIKAQRSLNIGMRREKTWIYDPTRLKLQHDEDDWEKLYLLTHSWRESNTKLFASIQLGINLIDLYMISHQFASWCTSVAVLSAYGLCPSTVNIINECNKRLRKWFANTPVKYSVQKMYFFTCLADGQWKAKQKHFPTMSSLSTSVRTYFANKSDEISVSSLPISRENKDPFFIR